MRSFNILPFLLFFVLMPLGANAEACSAEDRACVIKNLQMAADKIENKSWRDQTYREIAKTLAFDGQTAQAIALIDRIETPDTKAMTIRGIGMAAADNALSKEDYDKIFTDLREAAEKIEHPPSYAIALTYIAMSQAFAGDNEGSWKTAADMENDALRHKAFGETAEIQAEKGNFEAAMKSIGYIDSTAFKNKAYTLVAKIMADQEKFAESLKAAEPITNSYKKAQVLQYILDKQKPRDVPHSK